MYIGKFKCTGYNNTVGQCDSTPDITATGRRIVMGYSIALDPKYWRRALHEGWIFYVEGVGDCRADDTGSKIIGKYRMDIAVATVKQAGTVSGYRRVYLKRPIRTN